MSELDDIKARAKEQQELTTVRLHGAVILGLLDRAITIAEDWEETALNAVPTLNEVARQRDQAIADVLAWRDAWAEREGKSRDVVQMFRDTEKYEQYR